MDHAFVMDLGNQVLKVTLMLSAPMLGGALVIGILVSLFQAVTQINEQTLSFIPKILVIGGSIVIFGPWMLEVLTSYSRDLIIHIPDFIASK